MSFTNPYNEQTDEFAVKDTESTKQVTDTDSESKQNGREPSKGGAGNNSPKGSFRKSKPFQPIILSLTFLLLFCVPHLYGQFYGSIEQGITYSDNAFQLSDYDLQRNEDGNPDLNFVDSADDVILKTRLSATYDTKWRWWVIQPMLQLTGSSNVLNSEKQRFDLSGGIRFNRRFGNLGLRYSYTPEIYVRNYTDTDGTDDTEQFSYARNQYSADLNLKPFKASTVSLEYMWEEDFYNKFFTEFDGDIVTWTLGWRQSLPTFYVDGSYAYKVYETDSSEIDNPEDASYESNIYKIGILIKKMQLDSRYQSVMWRPELDLKFEERYYQGGDSWHRGRTDNINTTTAYLHFYFGESWNLNLDYSHIFRNVDAVNSSVRKYKEYSESKFGIAVRYLF